MNVSYIPRQTAMSVVSMALRSQMGATSVSSRLETQACDTLDERLMRRLVISHALQYGITAFVFTIRGEK